MILKLYSAYSSNIIAIEGYNVSNYHIVEYGTIKCTIPTKCISIRYVNAIERYKVRIGKHFLEKRVS